MDYSTTTAHAHAAERQAVRVVFFGMRCAFSTPSLVALLDAGVDVCAVVVPAVRNDRSDPPIQPLLPPKQSALLPIIPLANDDLVQIAFARGILVFAVGRLAHAETRALIASWQADLGCVACFPQRVPPALLALLPLGWVNVHPSLLPAHRGPTPIFWTLRAGESSTGVTVHRMDAGFDTGGILAQQTLALPDGITEGEVEQQCARLGAQLLGTVVDGLWSGEVTSRPQPAGGSCESWPVSEDFTLSTAWSARRIFNFMRGTAHWNTPYAIMVAGETWVLATARGYDPDATLDAPLMRVGKQVHIQCAPGVLRAVVAQAETNAALPRQIHLL